MQKLIAKSDKAHLLANYSLSDNELSIYQDDEYRWLSAQDGSVQGVIDLAQPTKVILPVNQAMLMFLLDSKKADSILNLGLGSAAIERALLSNDDIKLTSVELNQQVIEIARTHFLLQPNHNLILNDAAKFIATNSQIFDVILVDLFNGEQPASCLNDDAFWQHISRSVANSGHVYLNTYISKNDDLRDFLAKLKRHFHHFTIIEFVNCKNLVVVLGQQAADFINKSELETNKTFLGVTTNLASEIKEIYQY